MPPRTETRCVMPLAADPVRDIRPDARSGLSMERVHVIAVCVMSMAICVRAASAGPVRHGLDDFTVTTWNEDDGLSASQVTAIEQDHDGYLWIGTDVGLLRFDGVRFQTMSTLGETRLPESPV